MFCVCGIKILSEMLKLFSFSRFESTSWKPRVYVSECLCCLWGWGRLNSFVEIINLSLRWNCAVYFLSQRWRIPLYIIKKIQHLRPEEELQLNSCAQLQWNTILSSRSASLVPSVWIHCLFLYLKSQLKTMAKHCRRQTVQP